MNNIKRKDQDHRNDRASQIPCISQTSLLGNRSKKESIYIETTTYPK